MNITDIRVKLLKNTEGKLKAVSSIIIDDKFAVHDIKVIEGAEGCFIVMPSRKTPSGEYRDIAHPIKTSVREQIRDLVLAEYEKALSENE